MESVSQVFDEALTNCDWLLSSLDGFQGQGDDAGVSDLDKFWSDLVAASKVLSHEATKFSVAHSSPPFPDAETTKVLANHLCTAAGHSVGYLLGLPRSTGATFLGTVADELRALVANLRQFLGTIKDVINNRQRVQQGLFSTGILWEFCDRIPLLPKNNAEAVTQILDREERLISDALEELGQACQYPDSDGNVEDSEDDSEVIRGAALELLPSVKGLVKSSIAVLRRTKKLLSKPVSCLPAQLDAYVEQVSTLSSVVDDLVCSLYAPMNPSSVSEHGHLLSSKLHKMLETSKGIACEEDLQWIEFLSKAIEHNLQNLQTKLTT